jgi:peptidoglycan/xylan/chitin deacetylase (PgdA/CDA1 family)
MLGRVLAERLVGRPRVVRRAPGQPRAVALTFDDGPSQWTGEIAAALERHGCRGTFFLLGSAVRERPEVVAALAAAGHELGNHLYTHGDPERQSRAQLRAEIDRAAAAIGAAAGSTPRLVRPPYCGAPSAVARAAQGSRTRWVVLRSVDPADWSSESAAQIAERVLEQVGPGDIVCLHDGIAPNNSGTDARAATAEAVALLVPALLERNLRPLTVTELLA